MLRWIYCFRCLQYISHSCYRSPDKCWYSKENAVFTSCVTFSFCIKSDAYSYTLVPPEIATHFVLWTASARIVASSPAPTIHSCPVGVASSAKTWTWTTSRRVYTAYFEREMALEITTLGCYQKAIQEYCFKQTHLSTHIPVQHGFHR